MKFFILFLIASQNISAFANTFDEMFEAKWLTSGQCAFFSSDSGAQVRVVEDNYCYQKNLEPNHEIKWATNGRCAIYNGSIFIKYVTENHCSAETFDKLFTYQWNKDLTCQLNYKSKGIRAVEEYYCKDLPISHVYMWTNNGTCKISKVDEVNAHTYPIRSVPDIYCGASTKFSYGWSVGSHCNVYKVNEESDGQESIYLKRSADWRCGKLHPSFEYGWSNGGECNLYEIRKNSSEFLRNVPMNRCGDLSPSFLAKWTSTGKCGIFSRSTLKMLHVNGPLRFCRDNSVFTYEWTTDGKCQTVDMNSEFISNVPDYFCPGHPVKKNYFLDELGYCHLWESYNSHDQLVYIAMVHDDKCPVDTKARTLLRGEINFSKLRQENPEIFKLSLRHAKNLEKSDFVLSDLLLAPGEQAQRISRPAISRGSGVSGETGVYRTYPRGSANRGHYPSSVTGGGGSSYSHTGSGVYYNPKDGTSFKLPQNGSGSTTDTLGRPINCSNGVCYRQ